MVFANSISTSGPGASKERPENVSPENSVAFKPGDRDGLFFALLTLFERLDDLGGFKGNLLLLLSLPLISSALEASPLANSLRSDGTLYSSTTSLSKSPFIWSCKSWRSNSMKGHRVA